MPENSVVLERRRDGYKSYFSQKAPLFAMAAIAVAVTVSCTRPPEMKITPDAKQAHSPKPDAKRPPNTAWYTNNPATDTFYIAAADELAGLATLVNNEAGLERPVDFGGKTIILTQNISLAEYGSNFNGGKGWIPIGKGDTVGKVFKGVFDGNGKIISGLYIKDNDTSGTIGLFGMLVDVSDGTAPAPPVNEDGEPAEADEVEKWDDPDGYGFYKGEAKVINLGLADVNVTGQNFVGGIAGALIGSQILNSYTTGKVSGGRSVGGVVGYMVGGNCIVSKGYTTAAVVGVENVGGVVGYLDGRGRISDSYSAGPVSGREDVGGVAGQAAYLSGGLFNCYSAGSVTGEKYVGGVAGEVYFGGGISNCHSTGAVSGVNDVGGVAGGGDGDVTDSYSTGAVSGKSNVGGITGKGGGVSKCYSTGAVAGEDNVGGIMGGTISFYSYLIASYSTGKVSGKNNVGGIVGNVKGKVAGCYSTSTVIGENNVGGIAGSAVFTRNKPKNSISLTSDYSSDTSSITNCAALNPSATGDWLFNKPGRVVGSIERNDPFRYNNNNTHAGNVLEHTEEFKLLFKLSNNAAFAGLNGCDSDTCSVDKWHNKGAESLNGADVTAAEIKTDGTLGGRFTSENGWTAENGKLPGLFGQAVALPEYLK